ncbi:MAG: type II toxin-antitoxin system RelB/DinJ family antitoxin [Clostridiales Family XIII bacterium]|nr:type II toxin-antitoxin system RelB/DinJ family antitoxin [Clostridiales Family XIII bacterium]
MKAQNDVRVTIRVDKDLKENAETLFSRLGMNMSTAFNVFLNKAVDEAAIPFPVSTKKPVFGAGYTEADITSAFKTAVLNEIAELHMKEAPVALYDKKKKQAYLEFADGTKEYVNE